MPNSGVETSTLQHEATSLAAPTYSVITTCKGRLKDLKQSLPRFVALPDAEVIVVDYDCPDGTESFVRSEYPSVTVVKVEDRPTFNMPDARNQGAAQAKGKLLVFLDADVLITNELLDRLPFPRNARSFATFSNALGNSLRGSCFVRRADFEAIGGYDPLLRGYEGEDLDLYMRLRLIGAQQVELDGRGVEAVIEQSTEERLRFRPQADLRYQFLRGQLYQAAKEAVMRGSGALQLQPEMQKRLMNEVDKQLDGVFSGEKDFELSINIPDRYKRGLLKDWTFSSTVTVRASKIPPT